MQALALASADADRLAPFEIRTVNGISNVYFRGIFLTSSKDCEIWHLICLHLLDSSIPIKCSVVCKLQSLDLILTRGSTSISIPFHQFKTNKLNWEFSNHTLYEYKPSYIGRLELVTIGEECKAFNRSFTLTDPFHLRCIVTLVSHFSFIVHSKAVDDCLAELRSRLPN